MTGLGAVSSGMLDITRVSHRVFADGRRPYVSDSRQLRHYRDLLTPFGVPLDEGALERGRRNSYAAMSDTLVRELDGLAELDLIVLAYATPDSEPMVSAASHLAHVCPGEARAFAVSDQGVGAPFAALHLIAAHLRSPGFQHALLVVLEQTTLPNYDERIHAGAEEVDDSAVAIVIGAGGSPVAAITRSDGAGPGELGEVVDRMAGRARGRTLLLLGPTLDPAAVPAASGLAVHRASPRHLCTAVWVELSEHLAEWRDRYDQVLVVDHDQQLRQLHGALIGMRGPGCPD